MIVGVLGAGQLGRMLALAGYPLGLRFRFLDPAPQSPSGELAEQIVAQYDDDVALERFAHGLDVVTYEFENVPVATARMLAEKMPVFPAPSALEVAQDRLSEKRFFRSLNIPTPAFAAVETYDELQAAATSIGLPAVLKTRRMGYDGKGQRVLRTLRDLEPAWNELGGSPLILESFVPFDRELSILAVRGRDGKVGCYPLVENEHRDGILRLSRAPASGVSAELQAQADGYARGVLETLEYVGVLTIELFERDGGLFANEMAPRVHNSGHWTIEGAATSQFANHLRAILGLPLGSTMPLGHAGMLNLIGTTPDAAEVMKVEHSHLHLYGKAPRAGRKLGHVTVRADDAPEVERRIEQLRAIIDAPLTTKVSNHEL